MGGGGGIKLDLEVHIPAALTSQWEERAVERATEVMSSSKDSR